MSARVKPMVLDPNGLIVAAVVGTVFMPGAPPAETIAKTSVLLMQLSAAGFAVLPAKPKPIMACAQCGRSFQQQRTAIHCSNTCRVAAFRERNPDYAKNRVRPPKVRRMA